MFKTPFFPKKNVLVSHMRSFFSFGVRRRRVSSGKPEKKDLKVRMTTVMWEKWRMTTTWSSAEYARMVENYCAVTLALHHTTSTV